MVLGGVLSGERYELLYSTHTRGAVPREDDSDRGTETDA